MYKSLDIFTIPIIKTFEHVDYIFITPSVKKTLLS